MRSGIFVTIDGPHGVGKSSLVRSVIERVRNLGYSAIATKEPTDTAIGRYLKEAEAIYRGEKLACLAALDRFEHLEQVIKPTLAANRIIVCDRYIESSLVLQRMDGCSRSLIWQLHSPWLLAPDLSIILTARPATLETRLAASNHRSTRIEKLGTKGQEVRLYREAADWLEGKGFRVLALENDSTPANENAELIVREILELVDIKTKEAIAAFAAARE